jgi:exopolysaccharide production protein ExoZ
MVNPGRLKGLQLARALAALTVAYFHSFAIFNGWPQATLFPIPGLKEHGYLGVNFFFAISGYVISHVCDKSPFSVREFLAKRFFRLYPVYWCVVLAAIILKLFGVLMPTSYEPVPILYSMTLLPHSEGSDARPFLAVTWSLEFEIMFYLLAAFIVPIFRVWGLAAVLFGLVYWAYTAPPEITLHLVRTLNSDFLAGVLAYLLRKPLSYIPSFVLIPCGLFGYYSAVVLLIPFSGSLGGFLLIGTLANAKWSWDRWPLRWLVRMGDASYSLYLLHWVVIHVFVTVTGKIGVLPGWSAEPMRFAYLGVSCWLALQAFQFIERPIIEFGSRAVENRKWSVARHITRATP